VTASSAAKVGRPNIQLSMDMTDITRKDASTVRSSISSPKVTSILTYTHGRMLVSLKP